MLRTLKHCFKCSISAHVGRDLSTFCSVFKAVISSSDHFTRLLAERFWTGFDVFFTGDSGKSLSLSLTILFLFHLDCCWHFIGGTQACWDEPLSVLRRFNGGLDDELPASCFCVTGGVTVFWDETVSSSTSAPASLCVTGGVTVFCDETVSGSTSAPASLSSSSASSQISVSRNSAEDKNRKYVAVHDTTRHRDWQHNVLLKLLWCHYKLSIFCWHRR